MSTPVISCIIPTCNREILLKDAIDSILRQTYSDWELIIVDDGSTDGTEKLVSEYCATDKRILYFKNSGKGGSSARNLGISKAKGEFVAFLDDDDISLPHRFESQLRAAQKSGNGFIVSGYEVRERNTNNIKAKIKLELTGMGAGFPSRWLIKKELLEKVNGFDKEYPSMQDIELSYRLAEHEVFALHDDIVTIIYHTNNSVSKNKENAVKGKVLLMERLGDKMHPIEAAWWYFVIAMDYCWLNDNANAMKYLHIASITNPNYQLRSAYLVAKKFLRFGEPFRTIINKIIVLLGNSRFPELVSHRVL